MQNWQGRKIEKAVKKASQRKPKAGPKHLRIGGKTVYYDDKGHALKGKP